MHRICYTVPLSLALDGSVPCFLVINNDVQSLNWLLHVTTTQFSETIMWCSGLSLSRFVETFLPTCARLFSVHQQDFITSPTPRPHQVIRAARCLFSRNILPRSGTRVSHPVRDSVVSLLSPGQDISTPKGRVLLPLVLLPLVGRSITTGFPGSARLLLIISLPACEEINYTIFAMQTVLRILCNMGQVVIRLRSILARPLKTHTFSLGHYTRVRRWKISYSCYRSDSLALKFRTPTPTSS